MELIFLVIERRSLKVDLETRELLNEQVKKLTKDIGTHDAGSEERARAVKDLETLGKLIIEIEKTEADIDKSNDELSEAKKDRLVKVIIAGVEVFVPIAFYTVWMILGFKFEETGCITSTVFKGLIHFFRPTK